MFLIDLIITVFVFLIFPTIYVLIHGKVEKKKAVKMSLVNVIVGGLIFAVIIAMGDYPENTYKAFYPTMLYYFISVAILKKPKELTKDGDNSIKTGENTLGQPRTFNYYFSCIVLKKQFFSENFNFNEFFKNKDARETYFLNIQNLINNVYHVTTSAKMDFETFQSDNGKAIFIKLNDAKEECDCNYIGLIVNNDEKIYATSEYYKEENKFFLCYFTQTGHYSLKFEIDSYESFVAYTVKRDTDSAQLREQSLELNVKNLIEHIDGYLISRGESTMSNLYAKLEFIVYYLFTIYRALCRYKNEKFMEEYILIVDKVLLNYFVKTYKLDNDLVKNIVENRTMTYDKIVRTSNDKDGDSNFQLRQFISNDIYNDELFPQKIIIISIDEDLKLQMEISEYFQGLTEIVKPVFDKIVECCMNYNG